jgi:hypothetical protein
MVKRSIAIVLSLFLLWLRVAKAQDTRDYVISEIGYTFVGENVFKVIVHVENRGADAIAATQVLVTLASDNNRELIRDTLNPLPNGQSVIFEIPFRTTDFPAGTEQIIQVSVGIDDYELANTLIASDNIDSVIVPIPQINSVSSAATYFKLTGEGVIFRGEYYSNFQVVLGLSAGVAFLLVLWIISIILRLLFHRPSSFGIWQPPYGVMPTYDPHSVEGRRWSWQQHAQNNLLLAPPVEAYIHPIKLLTDVNGEILQNWEVIGLRLNHYDSYGRIARTQAIADRKWVRRLNHIIRKRNKYSEEKLQRMLRPIAEGLVKQFAKNIKQKNAFLPVAFDIRWEGKHGEIRIFFELYQFQNPIWYRIDRWEPMMQIISPTLQENSTFTMHGKESHEKLRDFHHRLRDDIIWLLLEMLRIEESQSDSQPVSRQQYDIPDTLSDIQPIPTEDMPLSLPTNA